MPYQETKWFPKDVMEGSNACILHFIYLNTFRALSWSETGNYLFGDRKGNQTMISVKDYTSVGGEHVNNI